MRRAASPSSRVARSLIVGVVVVALALGALRWLSASAGLGLFEFLQPSMSDLLDGRAANEQRLAAIGRVDTWMGQSVVPGAPTAGTQTFTRCERGQNNPEVDSGYRLRCFASGVVITSWVGTFDDLSRVMASSLEARCPGSGPWRTSDSPAVDLATTIETYECSTGITLIVSVGDSRGVSGENSAISPLPCTDEFRCISGHTAAELQQAVVGSNFYVTEQVNTIYFEDQL